MTPLELHATARKQMLLDAWHKASGYVVAVLAVFCLILLQGYISLQDERIELSQRVNAFKARGCPETLSGKVFAFSAHETVNLARPGYEVLSCYYRRVKV